VRPLRRARAETCGSLEAASFHALNGTLQEVRDISRVWKTSPTTESEPAQVFVGRDANEAGFKHAASGRRVLHLATHGFFLDGSCPAAPNGTRALGGLSKGDGTPSADNPLRLSGLALAGANRRASAGPDEDEGILTAEEVAALNLNGVEWAVLSACDTGLGEIKTGEGVFGLRRAFQVAGARTVIMSLWSVDDDATRDWMRALYEGRFQRALSTADAVHGANLAVLRARRARGLSTQPFYWAGFVAAGDWR
jgi:CHAT domain-containing protein